MKAAIGVLMIAGGVVFGLYAGLYWAFIGGIVSIIEAIKATPVEAFPIAFGIVRILCAGAIGAISALVLIVPGAAILTK